MTEQEYNIFFHHYIEGGIRFLPNRIQTLFPNVFSLNTLSLWELHSTGYSIIALITVIEERFIPKNDFKKLRNFQYTGLTFTTPSFLDLKLLSCYIYIRDCFGHNVKGELFSQHQNNTIEFLKYHNNGKMPFIDIINNCIHINNTTILSPFYPSENIQVGGMLLLHHIILSFYHITFQPINDLIYA